MLKAMTYHAMGETEKSDAAQRELLELPVGLTGYGPPAVFGFRGQVEAGLDWLEQNAGQMNFPKLAEAAVSPVVEPFRKNPRHEAVMRGLGLSKEQLSKIDSEVNLPD